MSYSRLSLVYLFSSPNSVWRSLSLIIFLINGEDQGVVYAFFRVRLALGPSSWLLLLCRVWLEVGSHKLWHVVSIVQVLPVVDDACRISHVFPLVDVGP